VNVLGSEVVEISVLCFDGSHGIDWGWGNGDNVSSAFASGSTFGPGINVEVVSVKG